MLSPTVGLRFLLAGAALRQHRMRTLLAVLGVAVAGAMLLDMVMLSSGMTESFRGLLDEGGFALRLTPRGTVPFDTDATIHDASDVIRVLQAMPEVTAVAPVLGASIHITSKDKRVSTAFGLGVDPKTQGDYTLLEGTDGASNALVANDAMLKRTGVRLGDTISVAVGYDPQLRIFAGARQFVVSGRAKFRYLGNDQAAGAMSLGTLQSMRGNDGRDRLSLVMIRVAPGTDAAALGRRIEQVSPSVTALSTADALRLAEERLSYFRQLALILGSVSFAVAFLLVTTLMTVSVNERAGEIAVLRALGVSRTHVVAQIALEGVAIASGGAVCGLALGLITARYLNAILSQFPGLPAAIDFFLFQPRAVAIALGILTLTGILAGAYPAWRAASLPIATTLRREAVA